MAELENILDSTVSSGPRNNIPNIICSERRLHPAYFRVAAKTDSTNIDNNY